MQEIIKKYRIGLSIFFFFIAVRVAVFLSFWQASADKGGWKNFYSQTDLWNNALIRKAFTPYCDGQPPLYTTFTSFVRLFWDSQWMVYFAQMSLALLSVFLVYKIVALYFEKRIAYLVAFLVAIEPYTAFYNWLTGSENLFIPIFLAAFYFFLRYFQETKLKYLFISGILFGLCSLTRSNTIVFVPFLSVLVVFVYLVARSFPWIWVLRPKLKTLIIALIMFNLTYVVSILPWMLRNKAVYGQPILGVVMATNFYYYNAPALLAIKNGTDFDTEKLKLVDRAAEKLGKRIDNFADCKQYGEGEFAMMLAWYKSEGSKILADDVLLYSRLHLIKSVPFFLKSGLLDMWEAYTGDTAKPDMSSALMKGDFSSIFSFLKNGGAKVMIYLADMAFWAVMSLSIIVSFLYALYRKRPETIFFFFGTMTAAYSALVVSPFTLTRYRLHIYFIFFASLIYVVSLLLNYYQQKRGQNKVL